MSSPTPPRVAPHRTAPHLVGDVLRYHGRPPPDDRVSVPLEEVQDLPALDPRGERLPHALPRNSPYDRVRQQRAQLEEEAEHGEVELRPRVRNHLLVG